MAIPLICVCGRTLLVPEKYAGKRLDCPTCHAKLHIPTAAEDLSLTRWFCRCGLRLKARPRASGRNIRCPRCRMSVPVPRMDDTSTTVSERFLMDDMSGFVQVEAAEPPSAPLVAVPSRPPPAMLPDDLELAPLTDDDAGEAATVPAQSTDMESDTRIDLPPSTSKSDILQLDVVEPDTYGVDSTVPPKMRVAPTPGKEVPAPTPVKLPSVSPAEEEPWAIEEDEGIRADQLTKYFNTASGTEAARAGVTQVLNGYWLYIPYALLAGCIYNLIDMARARMQSNPAVGAAEYLVLSAVILFLWAGFVGCIKDGVFERSMGIERMLYNAWRHFPRFSGSVLLMLPVGGLLTAGVVAAMIASGSMPTLVMIGVIAGALGTALFVFTLLLLSPVIAVLEGVNPFVALGRGLIFGMKHILDLLVMALVSLFVGGGILGVVFLIWRMMKMFLEVSLPPWLFGAIQLFFTSLGCAAIMGQVLASLMLLYLSTLDDEPRLQAIRRKLRGPEAVPARLYAAIVLATVALVGVSYARASSVPRPLDNEGIGGTERIQFKETGRQPARPTEPASHRHTPSPAGANH